MTTRTLTARQLAARRSAAAKKAAATRKRNAALRAAEEVQGTIAVAAPAAPAPVPAPPAPPKPAPAPAPAPVPAPATSTQLPATDAPAIGGAQPVASYKFGSATGANWLRVPRDTSTGTVLLGEPVNTDSPVIAGVPSGFSVQSTQATWRQDWQDTRFNLQLQTDDELIEVSLNSINPHYQTKDPVATCTFRSILAALQVISDDEESMKNFMRGARITLVPGRSRFAIFANVHTCAEVQGKHVWLATSSGGMANVPYEANPALELYERIHQRFADAGHLTSRPFSGVRPMWLA